MTGVQETIDAIDNIINARSVALIGASTNPKKFGYMTLHSLVGGGYDGQIYPINPKGGEILGLKVYTSLSELPQAVDLAIVVIPAKFVAGVLREAARMGTRGGLILTAGFREAGRRDLEDEIAAIPKETGLRFVGPNVQGINYLPNKMCAMFFPIIKTKGPVAIVSQSGTITAALSEWAADEGLGISAAINLGNQVDLCESDYLDFLAQDTNTKAIAMYIEGLKNGANFIEAVKRVARQKPVAILKGGRTAAGRKSAASHTGSLAGSHQVFSAACRQFGVVRADDVETLYDAVKALATLRPPAGNRVLTISTSGGAGTLGADEIEGRGLVLPELPRSFTEALKGLDLPPLATLSNPFDMASIFPEEFRKVAMLADKYDIADVILLSYGDPVAGGVELATELDAELKAKIAVSYFGGGEEEKTGRVRLHRAGIPVFPTPERAMRGIASAVWDAGYRQKRGMAARV